MTAPLPMQDASVVRIEGIVISVNARRESSDILDLIWLVVFFIFSLIPVSETSLRSKSYNGLLIEEKFDMDLRQYPTKSRKD